MITDYVSSFNIGDEDFLHWDNDETQKVVDYLKGYTSADSVITRGYTVREIESLEGFYASLKSEYSDHYLTLFNVYGDDDNGWEIAIYGGNDQTIETHLYAPQAYHDSYILVISSVPWNTLVNDPSLLDSEFLVAYGVAIQADSYDEIVFDPSDPTEYVENATVDGTINVTDLIVDRSEFLTDLFTTGMPSAPTNGIYSYENPLSSFELTLKNEYQDYYIMVYRMYDFGDYIAPIDMYDGFYGSFTFDGVIPNEYYANGGDEYFIFMASPYSEEEMDEMENPYDDMLVFGITFRSSENGGGDGDDDDDPDIDLPPEIINPTDLDSTQYIQVLDGTTLEHYSYVPDVYNVKISQSINGQHTLSFNLQPYTNASNIYTPRIIECDGEYFHVQQITKRHHLDNLEMDVLCEHVSYELNYPHYSFWDEVAEEYIWTEDTYRGTASEILSELLQYNNRFNIGIVDNDITEHTFTTSAEGFRTRINEFASFIDLEVRWNQFEVSLIRKRGRDHGTILEVGKNIIALTEIIDTVKLGKVKRSYEIETIDLNYIYDASNAPIEMHNIVLGDVLTIVDDGYRIQRKDRVVSITRDPFQKALPTIEFVNGVETFTSDAAKNENVKGVSKDTNINVEIYQEYIQRNTKANALGYYINASGLHSLATGYGTQAIGEHSTASGMWSEAHGKNSVANGYDTKAIGDYSDAGGYRSKTEGGYSVAFGYQAITGVDAFASVSLGSGTKAMGSLSFATGGGTEAIGERSFAHGTNTKAIGNYSYASGWFTQASGEKSHAEGDSTYAKGIASHTEGRNTQATGNYSHSEGFGGDSFGQASHSEGEGTFAYADCSHAQGAYNNTRSYASLVMGRYNKETNNSLTSYDGTGDAFAIGNGTHWANVRTNAFRVSFNGNVFAQGNYNTTGADYAEFFEWLDGNPANEDRRGYAVTVEGDKIRIATASDEYILGVVSVNPSVIGNSYEDQWNGMYLLDEWGNVEFQYVDAPYKEFDDEGNEITVYRKEYIPVLNPDYDSEQTYIPRSQRPEWDAVGMLGKLLVRDDGSCEINKYAKLSETVTGVLTNSTDRSQFFVLRRINDNLVEVLLK